MLFLNLNGEDTKESCILWENATPSPSNNKIVRMPLLALCLFFLLCIPLFLQISQYNYDYDAVINKELPKELLLRYLLN